MPVSFACWNLGGDARMPVSSGLEMTQRRSRLIAIQALLVGALALIVVLTLLQPDDEEPLFGVSTPVENSDRPVEYDRADRGKARSQGKPRQRALALTGPTAGPGSAFAGATASGATAGDPAPSPGVAGDGGDDESPTDDQYHDALARLDAKLQ
jgi:hypothetical protein